jgi:hypothetical protein
MSPRYEVRRQACGDFILWDTATNSQVQFAGPWTSASAASLRAGYYNRAWEALPIVRITQEATP